VSRLVATRLYLILAFKSLKYSLNGRLKKWKINFFLLLMSLSTLYRKMKDARICCILEQNNKLILNKWLKINIVKKKSEAESWKIIFKKNGIYKKKHLFWDLNPSQSGPEIHFKSPKTLPFCHPALFKGHFLSLIYLYVSESKIYLII
jgi:hypothetical protein